MMVPGMPLRGARGSLYVGRRGACKDFNGIC